MYLSFHGEAPADQPLADGLDRNAPSSNGRTSVFGSENRGSNPRGAIMRFAILLALLAPALAQSQQTSAPSGRAIVTGVAVDSVRGGYLRGATVIVSGTTLSATTDSAGRFRIDSVPAGAHYLEVMHPLLDSLSLTVRSPSRELVSGQAVSFILSVPSPSTIIATKCTVDDKARGAAALFGTVTEADVESPATGAIVSVEWLDVQLTNRSLTRLPQRRVGTVRADGTYRVCGIPDDLSTGVLAIRGADSTGTVPVNFGNRIAIVSFHLPVQTGSAPGPVAARGDSSELRPRGNAAITGRVLDASGAPLASARVAVEADQTAATTDNQGVFRLNGLRTGTRTMSVRRIGFASMEVPVDVSAATPRDVTVTMARYVAILDAVRVTAMRELGLQRVGFTDRQKSSAGKFFGPSDLQTRNPQRIVNLLEGVASLRSGINADGKRYITGRHNGCVGYYVDGIRWFSTNPSDVESSPDSFISTAEIGAVEVYDNLAAPPEYARYSFNGEPCAVVVIWTKNKLGT